MLVVIANIIMCGYLFRVAALLWRGCKDKDDVKYAGQHAIAGAVTFVTIIHLLKLIGEVRDANEIVELLTRNAL